MTAPLPVRGPVLLPHDLRQRVMTGESFIEVKVWHSGDAVGALIEGAYQMLEHASRVMSR